SALRSARGETRGQARSPRTGCQGPRDDLVPGRLVLHVARESLGPNAGRCPSAVRQSRWSIDHEVEVVSVQLVMVERAHEDAAPDVGLAVIRDPVVEVVDLAVPGDLRAVRPGA